jgi:hypothetical protein
MAKKYFLPGDDPGKVIWLMNFSSKLGAYAAKYGISPAEVTDMVNAAVYFAYWVSTLDKIRTFSQKATAFKNEVRDGLAEAGGSPSISPSLPDLGVAPVAVEAGIFDRVTAIAGRIKKYQSYTVADGEDLGIEGPEQADEPTPPTP